MQVQQLQEGSQHNYNQFLVVPGWLDQTVLLFWLENLCVCDGLYCVILKLYWLHERFSLHALFGMADLGLLLYVWLPLLLAAPLFLPLLMRFGALSHLQQLKGAPTHVCNYFSITGVSVWRGCVFHSNVRRRPEPTCFSDADRLKWNLLQWIPRLSQMAPKPQVKHCLCFTSMKSMKENEFIQKGVGFTHLVLSKQQQCGFGELYWQGFSHLFCLWAAVSTALFHCIGKLWRRLVSSS